MTPKKKTPRAAPRARSGKHLHAGVLVRAPDAEREAWARAAEAVGMTRLEWIRHILNGAARKVLGLKGLALTMLDDPHATPWGPEVVDFPKGYRDRLKKDRAKKG
jgi:hypothetical protein